MSTMEQAPIILDSSGTDNLTITKRERALFKYLDGLGKVGVNLLNRYIPKTIYNSAQGNLQFLKLEKGVSLTENDLKDLSSEQADLFSKIIKHIEQDYLDMSNVAQDVKYGGLINMAWNALKGSGKATAVNGIDLVVMPAGVALVFKKSDTVAQWNSTRDGDLGWYGLYRQRARGLLAPYARLKAKSPLYGRVMQVNASGLSEDKINEVLRHEYMHLLVSEYIEPAEDDSFNDVPEVGIIDKQLSQLRNRIHHIEQQMALKDNSADWSQYMEDAHMQGAKLNTRRNEAIDNSDSYYLTQEARRLFKDMRDELLAYNWGGSEIRLSEDSLVPLGQTWSSRINLIKHGTDKSKLVVQWARCSSVLSFCRKSNFLTVEEVLPILLSSQNFNQITKRLLLNMELRNGGSMLRRT